MIREHPSTTRAVLGAAGIAALLLAGPELAGAQDPAREGSLDAASASDLPPIPLTEAQEARARDLEGRLKCPVCRSQSIRSSRSFMAEDMQRKVREMVAQGSSDEEIVEYFVDRFGPYILLTPPRRGFNLTAYLIPFLAVVAGGVGVLWAAHRWRRTGPPSPPPPPSPESPYHARLERELEESR
ncbi:MAG TPA: cytochrome c-type biogenesis protein [Gemmatimonadota bacterium]|nr:cytochrome c-type biogenesis protein [Gemmatimonadota bacterium]